MNPQLIQLPLDPTGKSPNNYVDSEPHALIANRPYRAIALNYGAFYAESIKIVDTATGQTLTDGSNGTPEQYYCCEYYELPSARYGQEIDAIIIIKDPSVSNNVTVSYQALGGPFSTNVQAIIDQIENLKLDDRPVKWGDILGKPSEFPPSKHLHDIGDVFGFEYVTHALDRIRDAIEVGDDASHDAIYRYIDAAIAALEQQRGDIQDALNKHISDTNNPHKVTADQLNVYTIPQVNAITTPIQTSLNNHVGNTNNPHQVTADQVNTYTKPVIDQKITDAINSVRIPFTPVQQGGGANQGNNKVYLGWDGARPRIQVDSTDLGGLVTYNEMSANVNNLQNQINGKAPARGDYVYLNTSPTFWDVTANGTLYSNNDIWAFNSDGRLKYKRKRLRNALERLRKLRGFTYRYRPEALEALGMEDKEYVGYYAQDAKEVIPQAVGLAPFDRDEHGNSRTGQNFLTIQYEKTVPLVSEGVNELDLKLGVLLDHLGLRELIESRTQMRLEEEDRLYDDAN